jgi:aspartyl-tRNA(Asn)/glutamyl-tRNA(Gln) amidotransferase subunit C
MKVDRELVLYIARLAQIELSESEIELFTAQLGTILQYIEKLNEIKTTAEPFAFDKLIRLPAREDSIEPSLGQEIALRNAPESSRGMFRVPKIIP